MKARMRHLPSASGLLQDEATAIGQRCRGKRLRLVIGVALGARVAVEMHGLDVEVPDFFAVRRRRQSDQGGKAAVQHIAQPSVSSLAPRTSVVGSAKGPCTR